MNISMNPRIQCAVALNGASASLSDMLKVCLTSLIIPQTRPFKQSLNALKEIDL